MATISNRPNSGLNLNQNENWHKQSNFQIIKLTDINPILDLAQGGYESWRWKQDRPKEVESLRLHTESFKESGLLVIPPVLEVQETFKEQLDGKEFTYLKGTYVTIDAAGRLRAYKKLIKNKSDEGLLTQKELENFEVGVGDVTDQVLNVDESGILEEMVGSDGKIDPEVLERMWHSVLKLSTGNLELTIFQYINSAALIVTDPEQKKIFEYIHSMFIKYSKRYSTKSGQLQMTNRNVIHAILGKLPSIDMVRRNKKIKFNLKKIRYTNVILKNIDELRATLTVNQLPGPFLDVLGNYLLSFLNSKNHNNAPSQYTGYFLGKNQEQLGVTDPTTNIKKYKWCDVKNTVSHTFPTEEKLYTDEHFFHFKNTIEIIMEHIENSVGYVKIPASIGDAKRCIWSQIRGCWIKNNGASDVS